ncbi:hypothetical protein [Bradyrhizobium sp.]|uniref:hypothetical protein n=1 Tax=Bradyrhizobium sp. TaxID=376 RepID=UPI001EC96F6C|nr:hypothetical protein [Bradyrhizobium sp.]MBV8919816.1 hypothetical protein [Bradyrhizobium sp.]MBV9982907.1 hypothetical protein [Bradyrhizobium sp.]
MLDDSGWMANYNRTGALQTAAKNLMTQLSALAQNNADVYISVVPFEIPNGCVTGRDQSDDVNATAIRASDARMKGLCDNVEACGVTNYTVQIDTDGTGHSAVLPIAPAVRPILHADAIEPDRGRLLADR